MVQVLNLRTKEFYAYLRVPRILSTSVLLALTATIVVVTPTTSPASTGSGGKVDVVYSSYTDLITDFNLSVQPSKTLAPASSSSLPTITVDPSVTYQTWEGFGGSLEDTTVYNLNRLTPANRDLALEALFDPVAGNGFNLMRIPIGCADFCRTTPDYWTYNDNNGVPDPTLENFSVQQDIDNGLIDMLHDIMEINPDARFFSSMWSPPAWMKTNGSLVGDPDVWASCHLEDAPRVHHGASTGSSVDYYPVLADYYVRYIQAYQDLGVPIYAVTLQNEPDIAMPYPTTCFTPQQLTEFAVELGTAFDAAGLETKIWGLDANEPDALHYADAHYTDQEAVQHIDGLAYHNYGGTALWQPTAVWGAYPEKSAHVTEISNGAARLIEYFRNRVSSYALWATMYEFMPGPGPSWWQDKPRDPETDPDFWAPSTISFTENGYDDFQLNSWYHQFGQFSRYLDVGAVRIDSTGKVAGTVVNVAFQNPDGTIVIIATNRGDSPYNRSITDPGSKQIRIVTPSGEFTDTLPGDTVATYVITPTTGDSVSVSGASASANHAGHGAHQAVDGDSASLWTSGVDQAVGQHFIVDLGDTRTVDQLTINHGLLEGDFPESFDVHASADGNSWGSAIASANGTKGMTNVAFAPINARYLKVTLTAAASRWWTVAEASVYDSSSGVLPHASVSATAFASYGSQTPELALDGSAHTRWSSGAAQAPGQHFTIDLGSSRTVTTVELDTGANPGDYPRGWELTASSDGQTWGAPLAAGVGRPDTTVIEFQPVTTRYLRVTQTGSAPANFWSIARVHVGNHAFAPMDRSDWELTASHGSGSLVSAIDGSLSTRWTTGVAQAADQHLTVDLGAITQTAGLRLDAGTSTGDHPRNFAIDVSLDGEVWRELTAGEGFSSMVSLRWPTADARFVRVRLTDGGSPNWWSVHELDIETGPIADTPPTRLARDGWTAIASNSGWGSSPADALDGVLETRWTSGTAQQGTEWFQVDMGQTRSISAIQLNAAGPPDWSDQVTRVYNGDYARNYEVYVSNGGAWQLVAAGSSVSSAHVIQFPTTNARFINVQEQGGSQRQWGIAEFYAYE